MASFGGSGLIPLGGGAAAPTQAAIVAPTTRAKGAKPEELYRAWLEIAEHRIGGEQALLSGATINAGEAASTSGGLSAVLNYFDGLAEQLFTRMTDVGELSNYMAGDARRWRDLLRAFRRRSAAAKDAPRYHQLTRALAAAEFLASEPIANTERDAFALTDIGAELADGGRTIEISANFLTRVVAPTPTPNIAICLRDANGDVCGEAILPAPIAEAKGERSELFTATLAAERDVANVEVSLTRRAVD